MRPEKGRSITGTGAVKRLVSAVFALLLLFTGALAGETWEDRIIAAGLEIEENGEYTDLDHVAAYIVFNGELPGNYVTRSQAKKKGWKNGDDLWKVLPGYSIGGDSFGNREGLLPEGTWHECDLFYAGGARGSQRLVWSEEGEVYYTQDGYKSFTLIYPSGEEARIPNAAVDEPGNEDKKGKEGKEDKEDKKDTGAEKLTVEKNGEYTDKEHVALYIHTYGRLPSNYITKSQAQKLGWSSTRGNLWAVAPGKSIGGDRYGNYEGSLPTSTTYKECDINYTGGYRGEERIIFGADGSVYYSGDHYNSFEKLY